MTSACRRHDFANFNCWRCKGDFVHQMSRAYNAWRSHWPHEMYRNIFNSFGSKCFSLAAISIARLSRLCGILWAATKVPNLSTHCQEVRHSLSWFLATQSHWSIGVVNFKSIRDKPFTHPLCVWDRVWLFVSTCLCIGKIRIRLVGVNISIEVLVVSISISKREIKRSLCVTTLSFFLC